MRFPLIVLVVFAHSLGFVFPHIYLSADGWNLYHFFSEMISHNFCKIAVCWFFVFAGYFFFLNLPQNGLTGKWITGKWKKRIRTLLIPYLIWNLISVIVPIIKYYSFSKLNIPQTTSASVLSFSGKDLVYSFLTGPSDYPLWFMRDLMVMSLISPVIYYIFRYLPRLFSLVVLIGLFFLPFGTLVVTWRGYFFFSLGAFLGIQKTNILSVCNKVKLPAAILALLLLILATFYNDAPFHDWLLRVFYPFGMISFMNICDYLITNSRRCERLCKLSGTVFFIYAAHEILILGWTKGIFLRLFGNSLAGTWIRYTFVPIAVVGICLFIYYILNIIMPRTIAFICGGRRE